MRKTSYWLGFFIGLAAVLLGSPLTGNSQTRDSRAGQRETRDRFVISAKAGGINAVTGGTQVHGRGTSEWQQLTIKEDLEAGDVVKTGFDGRVEMLLNPGSYLRVGENSEFELADNSLENLEVRLLRGTAVVEATGAEDTELMINITTPDTKLAIVRRGLYRVNVVPGDGTELIVRKGRVMLDNSHTKIKGGHKVIFSSGNVLVAKLQKAEKKALDSLDIWSKERAETVAKANRKMRERDLSFAMATFNDYFWFSGFARQRSQGIWVYNAAYSCYTFVPFYGWGWGSPYGRSYSSGFYGCCGNGRTYSGRGGTATSTGGVYGGGYPGGNGGARGSSTGGSTSSRSPSPPPPPSMSAPRQMPAAAERKIDQLNNRMPNQ